MKRFLTKAGGFALCLFLLCGTVLAAASVGYKQINVAYDDVKLVVDGIKVTPKDVNGKIVDPFIYEGTTYVPIRAVGEALGKTVSWDGTTKTVYIGKAPAAHDYLTPYQTIRATTYDGSDYFTMMGKKYLFGISLDNDSMLSYTSKALFNLDGQYSSVEFDVGHIDTASSKGEMTLYIYVDDNLVDEIELTSDMQTRHISVPVKNGLQLTFQTGGPEWYYGYGLANLEGIT